MNISELELLDDISSLIFVLKPDSNDDLTYVAFNRAALDVFKLKLTDILGFTAIHVYQGVHGQYDYDQHLKSHKSGKAISYELLLPVEGEVRSFRTHLKPTFDIHGNVVYLIGTSEDITAENELKALRLRTKNVSKELEEFIYMAAHDLRSPMRSVHILADFLREDFSDLGDGKLDLIDKLENVSVQAISMLDEILQHAEITGTQESMETFNLSDLCNDILDMLDPNELNERCIDDTAIHADRVATQIVVRNLIDNALKHNPDSSVSLQIKTESMGAGFFAVTVKDNGQGMINPKLLFGSSDTPRSKSGFGLLAVRNLIKTRGGQIFSDAPEKGTGLSVTFTLPGTIQSGNCLQVA